VAERAGQRRAGAAHRRGLSCARPARGAGALFGELGLAGFQQARPRELSGGMRQRVAFLRTLLSGKPVLCLDEPFGALDAITRAEMQEWLAGALAREPRTVVLVTHDVEEAVLLADRVVVLSPRPGRAIASSRWRSSGRAAHRRRRGRAARAGPRRAGGGARAMRHRALRAPARVRARRGAAGRVGVLRRPRRRGERPAAGPARDRERNCGTAGLLWHNFAVTAEEVALGLALALAAGLALATVIHLSPLLRRAVYPLAVGSQACRSP
jgi:ATPase subunit of ABC transporter with duplicated ATPase domains